MRSPEDKEIKFISVVDISGKIIQEQLKFERSDFKINFKISDLEKGMYFILATTQDGQQKTLKLIYQ